MLSQEKVDEFEEESNEGVEEEFEIEEPLKEHLFVQIVPPEDLESYIIPIIIGGTVIRALCDLGASVSIMPHFLYQ